MTAAPSHCFHCGLPLPGGEAIRVTIAGTERAVCCHGCEAAALVIDAAGLADYYEWRTANAPRQRQSPVSLRLAPSATGARAVHPRMGA